MDEEFYKVYEFQLYMNPKTQTIITGVILISLIGSLYFFSSWFSQVTGYFVGEDETTKLARCLLENDAEFYDAVFCADCEKQLDYFEKKKSIIPVVDCGERGELCPNLQSVPAWYINGSFHYQIYNLTELSRISGCAYDSN